MGSATVRSPPKSIVAGAVRFHEVCTAQTRCSGQMNDRG
jgi:hypothetical protein